MKQTYTLTIAYHYDPAVITIIENLLGPSNISACWLHSELKEMQYIYNTKKQYNNAVKLLKSEHLKSIGLKIIGFEGKII